MESQRPHRDAHVMEAGFNDVLQERIVRKAPPHAAPPAWLIKWEQKRPALLVECFAEFLGVFLYCFLGIGASAAFFLTTVAKEAGFGSLLTIGFAYAAGIVFALICVAATSGAHISCGMTIAFAVFKGFPLRKVPFYIFAQLLGGFCGTIAVYGLYKQQLDAVAAEFTAGGLGAAIFTPSGPAGVLALFPGDAQPAKYLFVTEFLTTTILGIIVFTVLDASTFMISLSTAPFVIGLAYGAIIWAFAPGSVALNTARDLGGRMACASVYGSKCFTAYPKYTAIAALVNILGSLVGAMIQTCLLSDTARELLNVPPMLREVAMEHNERMGHTTSRLYPQISGRTSHQQRQQMNGSGSDLAEKPAVYTRDV